MTSSVRSDCDEGLWIPWSKRPSLGIVISHFAGGVNGLPQYMSRLFATISAVSTPNGVSIDVVVTGTVDFPKTPHSAPGKEPVCNPLNVYTAVQAAVSAITQLFAAVVWQRLGLTNGAVCRRSGSEKSQLLKFPGRVP
ncbi:hypothetical protein [Providencia vermicola]|uniref:hypothetical protein n=1 Tax=Providencia vermicola TaxID=333965 RepID=UPI003D26E3D8